MMISLKNPQHNSSSVWLENIKIQITIFYYCNFNFVSKTMAPKPLEQNKQNGNGFRYDKNEIISNKTFEFDSSNNEKETVLLKNDHGKNGKIEQITYALFEDEKEQIVEVIEETEETKIVGRIPYVWVWRNIFLLAFVHLGALYGLYLFTEIKRSTVTWTHLLMMLGTLGVQAGAHRLWAHKTYKANFGVRLFLSLCHVLALQNDIYEWSRDHRAHHKFSDTDGDPHDSTKGFFFSHVGWLMVKKHPEVKRRGKTIYMDDLMEDPIVRFQRKWYIPMIGVFWGAIPTFVPVLFWGEDMVKAFFVCVLFRYALSLNLTWLVNSWSHIWGYRPYDSKLPAVESSVRHLLVGEGFHNYHHTFPWDYSASELGAADVFNPCTAFIDLFHWCGWAWDLKKVPKSMVDQRMKRTGKKEDLFYYKQNTPIYEWIGGLATNFSLLIGMHLLNSFSNANKV